MMHDGEVTMRAGTAPASTLAARRGVSADTTRIGGTMKKLLTALLAVAIALIPVAGATAQSDGASATPEVQVIWATCGSFVIVFPDMTHVSPEDGLFVVQVVTESGQTYQIDSYDGGLEGYDVVLIETVGIGQSEADIRHLADRVYLVIQPLGGDEIQYLKAGIIEIPDSFILNKWDEPAARRSYHHLVASLALARPGDVAHPHIDGELAAVEHEGQLGGRAVLRWAAGGGDRVVVGAAGGGCCSSWSGLLKRPRFSISVRISSLIACRTGTA